MNEVYSTSYSHQLKQSNTVCVVTKKKKNDKNKKRALNHRYIQQHTCAVVGLPSCNMIGMLGWRIFTRERERERNIKTTNKGWLKIDKSETKTKNELYRSKITSH